MRVQAGAQGLQRLRASHGRYLCGLVQHIVAAVNSVESCVAVTTKSWWPDSRECVFKPARRDCRDSEQATDGTYVDWCSTSLQPLIPWSPVWQLPPSRGGQIPGNACSSRRAGTAETQSKPRTVPMWIGAAHRCSR